MEPNQSEHAGKACLLALQHVLLKGIAVGGTYASCIVAPILAIQLRSRPKELVALLPTAFVACATAGIAYSGGVVPCQQRSYLMGDPSTLHADPHALAQRYHRK